MPSTIGIVASGFFRKNQWLFVTNNSAESPYSYIYPVVTGTGIGTRQAGPTELNAATSSLYNAAHASFTANNTSVVQATSSTSPYLMAWPFDSSAGTFGTKYADPASVPTARVGKAYFHPNGNAVICGQNTTPFLQAFAWTDGSGFGTKYANPSAANGLPTGITFSENATDLMLSQGTGQVQAWPWSDGSGFGTRYTNAPSVPNNFRVGIIYSKPTKMVMSWTTYSSPFQLAWPWTEGTGFGTAVTPATQVNYNDMAFNRSGNQLFATRSSGGYIIGYQWSAAGTGTQLTQTTAGNVTSYSIDISSDNSVAAIGHATSPYIRLFPISGTNIGTAYTNTADAGFNSNNVNFTN